MGKRGRPRMEGMTWAEINKGLDECLAYADAHPIEQTRQRFLRSNLAAPKGKLPPNPAAMGFTLGQSRRRTRGGVNPMLVDILRKHGSWMALSVMAERIAAVRPDLKSPKNSVSTAMSVLRSSGQVESRRTESNHTEYRLIVRA